MYLQPSHVHPDNNKWLHTKQSSKLDDATDIDRAMRATLPFIQTYSDFYISAFSLSPFIAHCEQAKLGRWKTLE